MAGAAAPRELTAAPGRAVRLAGPHDDAGIRALLRRSVIPGAVRVALTREPSYAAGMQLAGAEDATVVAVHQGAVAGMGRCSIVPLHRNGAPVPLGYLGELRLVPDVPRPVALLRDGYAALHEATRGRVQRWFTSIADDNARARRVLHAGGRLGLPAYRPLCPLVTLVAPVRAHTQRDGGGSSCTDADRAELTAFMQRHARTAQLTLAWDDACWAGLARHGVTPASFVAVRRGGRIVAAAAVWDQRAFRQVVIDGYGGVLAWARPIVNVALAAAGRPSLPPPGATLAQGAVLGAAADDDADWPALWHAISHRARDAGIAWLTLARDARDPALPLLRRLLRPRSYHTTLYEVAWPDGPAWTDPWDARLFRPEVGLL